MRWMDSFLKVKRVGTDQKLLVYLLLLIFLSATYYLFFLL